MAEPRFNNPYFWPPPPTMPSQSWITCVINKIKEQLMAEKSPPHLPPTSVPSQQPLSYPSHPPDQPPVCMSLQKLQQVPGLHPQAVPQPDVGSTRTACNQHRYGVGSVVLSHCQHFRIQHRYQQWDALYTNVQ
ncbi:hypothetical protein GDO86_019857 [Hymenochirus boettgeri]|uniref:Uncharacterized protein n=1 Tax=Hymenochirus boettgeri TaxID=247094 RepID=A0A8T2IJJ9_9PIPI|nr:hypothetical protein GDO86_019857 [Hymenochirus boettgeri]